jgi:PHP domain.
MPVPKKLEDWHREILISYTCRDKAHLEPFLKNAGFRLQGRNLTVCLPGAGCAVLEASGAGKEMEKAFRMLFHSDIKVSFTGPETENITSEDYFAKKMETEAKIVAQVLSGNEQEHRDVKSHEKKNGGKAGNSGVIYGKPFKGEPVRMIDVDLNSGNVVLSGEILKVETRELKNGRVLLTFDMTDRTSSLTCKAFIKEDESGGLKERLKPGVFVRVNGDAEYDPYERELIIKLRAIECTEGNPNKRMDTAEQKRVELHLHTQMSQLDAVTSVKDAIERAAEWGRQGHSGYRPRGGCRHFLEAQDVSKKLKKDRQEHQGHLRNGSICTCG